MVSNPFSPISHNQAYLGATISRDHGQGLINKFLLQFRSRCYDRLRISIHVFNGFNNDVEDGLALSLWSKATICPILSLESLKHEIWMACVVDIMGFRMYLTSLF